MFTGSYPTLMAAYNRWMNQNTYAGAARLTEVERKRDRGAFFKSIHATLNHLIWGDRIWLCRFTGAPHPIQDMRPGQALYDSLFEDLVAQTAARGQLDQEIIDWAGQLTPQWLQQPMTWTNLAGTSQTQLRMVLVTQLFNHQTHHRGQVHAMLTSAGIDIGPTDIQKLPLLAT